ncbi:MULTISPECIES: tetratricopeptide repeat protein [Spirulina sp. CCY15215]|uniref:tetratricopeptide repeat protein n=1 Tax=Spirulina sp. CCY15215 TaxID=2767591 RepID=UPI0019526130|nr:tetratricopeptide repeat protein [Spirulina major]
MKVTRTLKLVTVALSLWLGATASAFAFNRPNGRILESSGDVVVLRGDRNIRATLGMTIYPSDRLQVNEGGQLLVLCANLETQAVSSGSILPNRCTGAREEAKCSPDLAGCPDRGTILAWGDTSIPFSVSPRRTKVFKSRPILRWNPVAGATSYLVTVTGVSEDGREMQWSVETTDTSLVYIPESDEQVLQPGWDYLLVVETDTGVASFEESVQLGGMGFQLLDKTEEKELRSRQSLFIQQSISLEAKGLAIARLFLEYDAIGEAILLLESVLPMSETAALHLLIGELYQDRLLIAPPAAKHYERAIALADEANLEEKALAYEGLGRVRAAMQNYTDAIDLLTQARRIYEELGDRDRLEELDKTIQELITDN